MKYSVIKLLLKYLEQEGVKYIFGIPGKFLMPFYDELYNMRTITPILAKRHEGAVFIADGYARVSKQIGVCCATAGAESTNLLAGIGTSYAGAVPLFVLTASSGENAMKRGLFQEDFYDEIDVMEMFKTITKLSVDVSEVNYLSHTIRHCLRVALNGRKGPVHLNLPFPLMKEEVEEEIIPPSEYRLMKRTFFDREEIKKATKFILQAQNPVILIGNGVNNAKANRIIRKFAERLVIPVATTPKAKGAFPENHLLSLGIFGSAGTPIANKYLHSGEVDVLLAVGTSLNELSSSHYRGKLNPTKALIQIDIEPYQIGKNCPTTVGLCGDAHTLLTEMMYQISRDTNWNEFKPKMSIDGIRSFKKENSMFANEKMIYSDSSPVKPQRLMKDLRDSLPDEAIVFTNRGNSLLWALQYFPCYHPGTFLCNIGFSSKGYAIAAAIGGKIAAPQKNVIAIVGDESFGMNGMEIATAVNYNIPVIWLVLNNSRLGTVYSMQKFQYQGRYIASTFKRLDVVKIAEGLGAQAVQIEKPGELKEIMPRLIESKKPTVINAIIDSEEMPSVDLF